MLTDLFVPVLTPFGPGGSIDDAALAAHCRWVVAQGATGVMLFGTTGEGPSITVAEKLAATAALLTAEPTLPIIGAVTESSIVDVRNCLAGYNRLALQAVLVLPPYYFRDAGPDGFAAFFEDVVANSSHPVLAYHIPSLAPGVPLDRIAGHGLLGVKDSSGDARYTAAALSAGLTVFVGAEALIPDAIAAGAAGTIAGMANLLPGPIAQLCQLARSGELAEAYLLRDRVLRLQQAVIAAAPGLEFLNAFKDIAARLHGHQLGSTRLPLLRRREYLTPDVLAALDAAGALPVG